MKYKPLKKTLEDSIKADTKKSKYIVEKVVDIIEDTFYTEEEEYEGSTDLGEMLGDSIFYIKAMSILYASSLKKEGVVPAQSELLKKSGQLTKKYEELYGKVL